MQAVHPGLAPIQIRPRQVRPSQMRAKQPSAMRVRPSQSVYRRRRIAVLLCAAAVFVAGFSVFKGVGPHQLTGVPGGGPLTAAGQPVSAIDAHLAARIVTIVQPGDTLWTLARRAQPDGDVRPLVQALEAQRHGRTLMVGEHIVVSLGK